MNPVHVNMKIQDLIEAIGTLNFSIRCLLQHALISRFGARLFCCYSLDDVLRCMQEAEIACATSHMFEPSEPLQRRSWFGRPPVLDSSFLTTSIQDRLKSAHARRARERLAKF